MTTKTTYVATAPDGSEYTRTTATKTYEWAVLAYSNGTWGVVSFNGRADLAFKEAHTWAGRFDQIVVVEAHKS